MINFPYDNMIAALDNEVFSTCVSLLWPILGYRFLKEKDVRKVDLIERVYEKVSMYDSAMRQPLAKGNSKAGTLDRYAEAIKFYFDNGYLSVEKGSRAEAYSLRAQNIISSYAQSENPLSYIEDLFAIYLCLSREAYPNYLKKSAPLIASLNYNIGVDDAALLKNLWSFPFTKAAPSMLKVVAKPEKQDEKQKDYLYLNNILLYCSLMQFQNEIEGDEE